MLEQIERFTILLFSLEYVMRFWASAEDDKMGMYEASGEKNEMMTRVRYRKPKNHERVTPKEQRSSLETMDTVP